MHELEGKKISEIRDSYLRAWMHGDVDASVILFLCDKLIELGEVKKKVEEALGVAFVAFDALERSELWV